MSLYAGIIYGLILFVVVFMGMLVFAKRSAPDPQRGTENYDGEMAALNAIEQAEQFQSPSVLREADPVKLLNEAKASRDALARMKALKELRAANMITETEYEKKRAEILKDL